MDTENPLTDLLPRLQKHLFSVMLAVVGLILLGYGLIAFLGNAAPQEEIEFVSADAKKSNEKIVRENIVVDVSGAVQKPGVYHLSDGARVQDGLLKAGGLSADADREWVGKQLNLAAKLADGGKLYIPYQGDPSTGSGQGGVAVTGTQASGLININTASSSELDTLPGVGEVTAEKIIAGRPYVAVEELLEKKIVGNKTFEQIREKISVY